MSKFDDPSVSIENLKLKVLIVGDGDLSFSLSYCRKFFHHRIVATCYEQFNILKDRYKEFGKNVYSILKESEKLRRKNADEGMFGVFFGVDAINLTKSLSSCSSLLNDQNNQKESVEVFQMDDMRIFENPNGLKVVSHILSSSELSDSHDKKFNENQKFISFDRIIFNFPHIGVESINKNSALIAHFFHSAKEVISCNPNSPKEIWISLCNDQFEEWEVLKHSQRLGLILKKVLDFEIGHWEGYQHKRHQINRSFPIKNPKTYIFTIKDNEFQETIKYKCSKKNSEFNPNIKNSDEKLDVSGIKINSNNFGYTSKTFESKTQVEENYNQLDVKVVENKRNKKKRKPKNAIPKSERIRLAKESHVNSQCIVCRSVFKTQRSLYFHCLSKHRPDFSKIGRSLRCCGRNFPDDYAFDQHKKVVHELKISEMKFYQKDDDKEVEERGDCSKRVERCTICGQGFNSKKEANEHIKLLEPLHESYYCEECGDMRIFPNKRAIVQHLFTIHGKKFLTGNK